METVQNLVLTLALLEFIEFFWQKGSTLQAYLQNLLNVYSKGVIFFACLHPTFFFILFCIFSLNIQSLLLLLIAVFKFADISVKISLLNKIQNGLPLGNYEIMFEKEYSFSTWAKLLPLFLYTSAFYIALAQNFNFL